VPRKPLSVPDEMPPEVLEKAKEAYKEALEWKENLGSPEILQKHFDRLKKFRKVVHAKYRELPEDTRAYIDARKDYGGLGPGVEDWREILSKQITALGSEIQSTSFRALFLHEWVAFATVLKCHWPTNESWNVSSGTAVMPSPAERFIMKHAERAGLPIRGNEARGVVKRLKAPQKPAR
jgi:hypothetical protein